MTDSQYFGVIDIGSNSVRLVVYSGLERVAASVFNEKIMCGLGAAVGATGKMGEDAMALAVQTIRRFSILARHMGVSQVEVVATAAVRDAENGADFIARVLQETGYRVRVISGEEEGRLSALGVLSGDPTAEGVMGDLGGGSLELAVLEKGKVGESVSLPVGPLRLISQFGKNRKAMQAYLAAELGKIDWLETRQMLGKTEGHGLYLVGGAWRNMAKLMMKERYVPLPVLHGFRVKRSDMRDYARRVSRLTPETIPFAADLSPGRREVLPVASLVLRQLLKAVSPEHVTISSYGLREGLLFSHLDAGARQEDPFLHQCRELALERCRFPEHSELIYDWTRVLFRTCVFENKDKRDRLHRVVCLLSDIAWRGHPDFRAERAVEIALHGQFVGVSHRGRAYLAVALNQIYGAPISVPAIGHILPLLTAAQMMDARILGAAVRLAQRLSGGASYALEASRLKRTPGRLKLCISETEKGLVSEVVSKRLEQLGQIIGVKTSIVFNMDP